MAAFSLQVVAAIRGLWLVLGPEIAEGLSLVGPSVPFSQGSVADYRGLYWWEKYGIQTDLVASSAK